MTPLSPRYVPALLVVLTLTLVPVVVHSYLRVQIDECSEADWLTGPDENSDAERVSFMRSTFRAFAWREGELGNNVRTVILRSYDAKRLYYRPEYRLMRGSNPFSK